MRPACLEPKLFLKGKRERNRASPREDKEKCRRKKTEKGALKLGERKSDPLRGVRGRAGLFSTGAGGTGWQAGGRRAAPRKLSSQRGEVCPHSHKRLGVGAGREGTLEIILIQGGKI